MGTEKHEETGDEFDPETFVERLSRTFITDFKLSYRSKVAIVLDHSSSIEDSEQDYKCATVALCEALKFLKIKFGVYAFSMKPDKSGVGSSNLLTQTGQEYMLAD